ncbi:hypothetical protein K458DRAFT_436373 [Lentithecium fluviatile CBS 122367]|uniref:Uncharacterized protein n=1 Tax=Lentithecium fluviatile CBS 122367 TaxID=1168545 RepID=A0A6G1IHY8_9PLEO|nr:hypothetical protein K458DRAFT_436373 [Lentithecium fluviatile CBS 122367]
MRRMTSEGKHFSRTECDVLCGPPNRATLHTISSIVGRCLFHKNPSQYAVLDEVVALAPSCTPRALRCLDRHDRHLARSPRMRSMIWPITRRVHRNWTENTRDKLAETQGYWKPRPTAPESLPCLLRLEGLRTSHLATPPRRLQHRCRRQG